MSEQIKVDLDPKKVVDSMLEISEKTKKLAEEIETALGKQAPKSVGKLEEAAEKGTNKISSYFRNLGQRVKEDLKTAFAMTEVMGGAKFAKEMGSGVKQVFEMERAFDRLNTRLGLSQTRLQAFKKEMGRSVAGTGQKLEDILPGVETAAAKGGVKSPEQLARIGQALGQVRATTGENVEGVSESVIEILKNQGQQITAESFKKTLDAIQSTRVAGAFKNAGEAAQSMEQLAPYAKQLGLSTRELGGMSATAGRAGAAGQDILHQLLEKASQPGMGTMLNKVLGADIFKVNKAGATTGMNAEALGKINTQKFGSLSPQILEQATGLTGASGADLVRFVNSFKTGMGDFQKVVHGANETATQFNQATDNLASKIDRFRERSKEVGREIGGALSVMVKDLAGGNIKKGLADLKDAGKSAMENKGTLALGLGGSAIIGALAGGGMRTLLGKVGGGLPLGGVVGAAAAKAAGIQQVYVVNAAEISAGGAGAAGALGKFGKVAAGATLAAGVGVAAYEGTSALIQGTSLSHSIGDKLYDILHPDEIKTAVYRGTVDGQKASKQKPTYTNPSDVTGRGTSQ